MTTTEIDHPPTVNENGRAPVGPRILLGVTGSVAAIKAPEVVVQLVTQCNAEVKVVLSRGGKTFWDKAADYDPVSWERLRELLQQVDVNERGDRAVEIHGTLRSLCVSSDVSKSRRYETT
jgi:3-polyprenyl-4-hydroxybenzoate decarboxylase